MKALDPSLANLASLSDSVQWMNGIQFYLTRDVPITHGHIIFVDSPWALTAVSQRQFWTEIDFAEWGDGLTRGVPLGRRLAMGYARVQRQVRV